MSALAKNRDTKEKIGDLRVDPVAAATTIFAGALVCLDAAGNAVPASTAVNLKARGRAEEAVDNSAGIAGALSVRTKRGIFRFENSASSDEITAADIEKVCYIVDDQTVAKTDGAGTRSVAGKIISVETAGVFVEIGVPEMPLALGTPVVTVGTIASTTINVAIQMKDAAGADLATRGSIMAYLSDDANGDSIAGTAPDTVAIGTDGLAIPLVADKAFQLVSEADGDIDIDITEDGTDTWYLILVLPDGRLVSSDAITFA